VSDDQATAALRPPSCREGPARDREVLRLPNRSSGPGPHCKRKEAGRAPPTQSVGTTSRAGVEERGRARRPQPAPRRCSLLPSDPPAHRLAPVPPAIAGRESPGIGKGGPRRGRPQFAVPPAC